MNRDISVLIVGYGSIGERHTRNLRQLGITRLYVCDPDSSRREHASKTFDAVTFSNFEEAITSCLPTAVAICTPPDMHVPQAIDSLSRGAHVFVEKPLSNDLQRIDELLREAVEGNKIIQVGYNWRFSRSLKKVESLLESGKIGGVLSARAEIGQYLPDWHPSQDYRQSYTADASRGGGIILDSTHEIDYLFWLLGEVTHVYCMSGTLSDLEVKAEDTAEITMRFASGCIGEIHLDFVQRSHVREFKIVGTDGAITCDLTDGKVSIFTVEQNKWKHFTIPLDLDGMYMEEMNHFLTCIEQSKTPVVDLFTGFDVLKIALTARQSSEGQRLMPVMN